MSLIVVDELKAIALTQDFTIANTMLTGLRCKSIRPLLYLHNDPTGTFTITLKEGATVIDSKSLTGAEIVSTAGFTAGQFHWGIFNFEFDKYNLLKKNTTYTIELDSSGYSFSEFSYLGWIKPHEDLINSRADAYDIFTQNPYGYELWGFRV